MRYHANNVALLVANLAKDHDIFATFLVVTNEKVSVYVNYDTVTKRLCDFDIEFESIERDKLIFMWRKKQSKKILQVTIDK